MKKVLKEILFWTWCLPQTLLGFILKILFKGKKNYEPAIVFNKFNNITYYDCNLSSGSISLGKYLLICKGHSSNTQIIKHEYGHQKQSFILGPLYLLVIGLPSLLWANIFWNPKKHNYYWFYTESWANKLGNVKEYE